MIKICIILIFVPLSLVSGECRPKSICILRYSSMDFDQFEKIAADAIPVSKAFQWNSGQMKNWLTRLTNWCVNFNRGIECTGNRWWNCASQEFIDEFVELAASPIISNGQDLINLFNSIADLCENGFANEMERDHPCMTNAYSARNYAEQKNMMEEADQQMSDKCRFFNCQASKTYVHVAIDQVKGYCERRKRNAHLTLLKFIHPMFRLTMQMSDQKFICPVSSFPDQISNYNSDFNGQPPKNLMVSNAQSPRSCRPVAATTRKATTRRATTRKATTRRATTRRATTRKETTTTKSTTKTTSTSTTTTKPIVTIAMRTRSPWRLSDRIQKALNENNIWFIDISKVIAANGSISSKQYQFGNNFILFTFLYFTIFFSLE